MTLEKKDDDELVTTTKTSTTKSRTSWVWKSLRILSDDETAIRKRQNINSHCNIKKSNLSLNCGRQQLDQLVKPILTKLTMKLSCCACCCFYPKYKRKVDNIYPRQVDAPLVKNEVDKLQYYVTVHPEKLSKIGDCLYHNLKRGLNGAHKNRNYVKNTIEAVEKILVVITPQNLNYFAPYYLKIIQKLLEHSGSSSASGTLVRSTSANQEKNVPNSSSGQQLNTGGASGTTDGLEYQKMAASLFQKFCDKEASNTSSTVNYQLNFDQFVCQFSLMCYNTNKEERVRAEIRSSGLQCLASMVKRLVPDDNLRAGYIWENMDKIIPALLFIMHETYVSQNPRNIQSQENEFDQPENDDFNRYLYGGSGGDFYLNKINSSSNGFVPPSNNEIARPDSVRIHFTKSTSQLSDSRGNTPDESNVMITTNNNQNWPNNQQQQVIDPEHEAKLLLKSISSKADYTTIGKIVVPILAFLDDNKPRGWELAQFVRCIFLIVMYNVKQQHAIVIKELIKHIDSHRNSSALLKCYILRTINVCIGIAAMQSVGTTGQIIEIFTNLLKHLNFSVEKAFTLKGQLLNKGGSTQHLKEFSKINQDLNEEQKLQKEIIRSMGQFTSNLPDYAKNDVFMFIARQINSQPFNYADLAQSNEQPQSNTLNSKDQLNSQLRAKYFECLHEICTKYRPSQLFSAFTSGQFVDDILRLTLVNDWASRRKAHEILQLLLDKYQMLDKVRIIKPSIFSGEFSKSDGDTRIARKSLTNHQLTRNQTYLSQLDLNATSSSSPSSSGALSTSREDMHFMRKNGRAFLAHLNESLFLTNNRRENFESIYLTAALFLIGLFNENEFLGDLIRFGFHVQELALLNHDDSQFSFASQCNVHKFVCAYFLLLSKSSGFDEFYKYASAMCDLRRRKELFKFVYPEYLLLDSATNDNSVSGNHSLSEIETEFKRELATSAKEYTQMVKREEVGASTADLCSETKSRPKLAAWLFDKQIMEDLLKDSHYPTTSLYVKSSDFSLSVNYLQQTMVSIQTSLRYRSPYSCSHDSIAAINANLPAIDQANQHQLNSKGHNRMYSGGMSPSINQLINTPRRSIDAESNGDGDDTSYDSTSQVSVDYDILHIPPPTSQQGTLSSGGKLVLTEPQHATISSLNAFKQQQLAQQQDHASFETIKRVLFNGNGGGLSSNNSAAGGQTSSVQKTSGASSIAGGGNKLQMKTPLVPEISADDTEASSAALEAETSMRIISEFKQKPFDELKQTLIKTNQSYVNPDKYQQVLDLISREIHSNSSTTDGGSGNTGGVATIVPPTTSGALTGSGVGSGGGGSYTNISLNNLKNTSISSMSSNQSASMSSNNLLLNGNANTGHQKNIPLSDIEFPKLFMF